MRSAVCPQTLDMPTPFPHLLFSAAPPSQPPASGAAANGGAVLTQDDLKRIAAHRAVELVAPGMVLGLGTGSTAAHALDRLGDLLRCGALHDVVGIPTSLKTEEHAGKVGIPLTGLGIHPTVHLSIDGADEVDAELNLVKGRGGSLLREKMIEGSGERFIVIVDESKLVPRLGCTGAVPVEVVPFGWSYTLGLIKKLFEKEVGFGAKLRTVKVKGGGGEEGAAEEKPFVTDNDNYIVDMFFENGISGDLREISDRLLRITGVVEHGMFLGMATSVIVAKKDGGVIVLNK